MPLFLARSQVFVLDAAGWLLCGPHRLPLCIPKVSVSLAPQGPLHGVMLGGDVGHGVGWWLSPSRAYLR